MKVKIVYKYAKIDVFLHTFHPYLCNVKRYQTQIMRNVYNNCKKVILTVAIMSAVMGYANGIVKNAKKAAIVLKNVKQGNLFSIKDSNGLVLYKELIEDKSIYSKGFDLSALPHGDYELVFSETVEDAKHLERIYKFAKRGDYKIVYHSQGREFTEYINNYF